MCLLSRRKMERKNASRSNKTHLPQEIIEGILSRHPVKSLLRFRCVSKSWHSLIGSERFIKIHLQNSTKNTSLSHHRMIFNLVQHHQRLLMHCSWCSLLNEPAFDKLAFKDLFKIQWKSITLVGSCNGLVCFLLNRQYFFLWNPSMKKCKKLPDADDRLYDKVISKYGFGYDESSNDYKVLVMIFCYKNTPNQFVRRVFSLKTNSWKTLKYEDDSSQHFGGAGKFANGNLHWNRAVSGRDWEVVSFDLKCEAFEIVEQPSYSKGPYYQSVGVIEGCLSVLCDYRPSHSDIWVMKQYGVKESWVKVVTFPHVPHFSKVNTLNLLFCSGPNGEVVLFCRSGFLFYYPKDDVYRYCQIRIMGSVVDADCCIESLVSLDSDAEQGH